MAAAHQYTCPNARGLNINIETIRKVLALAGHPNTPDHEALAASRILNRLLQSAQVSLIEAASGNDDLVKCLREEISRLHTEVTMLRRAGVDQRPKMRPAYEVLPTF
jgi:hypothetical protein